MIFDSILSIVNKFIPDSKAQEEAKVAIERELTKQEAEYTKQMELQANIIRRESEYSGMLGKWRPITALIFVGMLVVHYLVFTLAPAFVVYFDLNVYIPADPGQSTELMEVIKFCLGGYIFSRSAEKGIRFWKK